MKEGGVAEDRSRPLVDKRGTPWRGDFAVMSVVWRGVCKNREGGNEAENGTHIRPHMPCFM